MDKGTNYLLRTIIIIDNIKLFPIISYSLTLITKSSVFMTFDANRPNRTNGLSASPLLPDSAATIHIHRHHIAAFFVHCKKERKEKEGVIFDTDGSVSTVSDMP